MLCGLSLSARVDCDCVRESAGLTLTVDQPPSGAGAKQAWRILKLIILVSQLETVAGALRWPKSVTPVSMPCCPLLVSCWTIHHLRVSSLFLAFPQAGEIPKVDTQVPAMKGCNAHRGHALIFSALLITRTDTSEAAAVQRDHSSHQNAPSSLGDKLSKIRKLFQSDVDAGGWSVTRHAHSSKRPGTTGRRKKVATTPFVNGLSQGSFHLENRCVVSPSAMQQAVQRKKPKSACTTTRTLCTLGATMAASKMRFPASVRAEEIIVD